MLFGGLGIDKGISYMLKHLGLADLSITNIGIFSQRALYAAIPMILFLLCFPPEQCCPLKCKVLDGRASQNRLNSSTLQMSCSWYLNNVVGRIFFSQDVIISFATFLGSPNTYLNVTSFLKREKCDFQKCNCLKIVSRELSLVVSDLHSETKGSRFESGCQLCAEVRSLQ